MPEEREISEPIIIESHYLSENLLDSFPSVVLLGSEFSLL